VARTVPFVDRSITAPFDALPAGIGHDDVVLTSRALAYGVPAIAGKGIATPLPEPFVDDIDARRAREAALRRELHNPRTALPQLREAGVQWLVLTPEDARPWAGVLPETARTDDLVVYRVE
jgi:hypothetical protein